MWLTEARKEMIEAKRGSKEDFVKKSIGVHGTAYDYSRVTYVNSQTKVIIICPQHGEFTQTPAEHVRGHGCSACAGNTKLATKDFITECSKLHEGRYDYSRTKYTHARGRITVECPTHGEFTVIATEHKNNKKKGCPECSRERVTNDQRVTTEDFIKRYRKIHGSRFDFAATEYVTAHSPITVTCEKHGAFSFQAYRYAGCPVCGRRTSEEQRKVTKFIKSLQLDVRSNSKVDGVEFDIWVPERRLAIEVNGVYWHSEQYRRFRQYHVSKTLAAKRMGIQLIHLWDYEINEKPSLLKSMLRAKLGMVETRIAGRKTQVRPLDNKVADSFLDSNHLQGACVGTKVAYGLFHADTLISVMTFGVPRFSTKASWELLRFCSERNTIVTGGASKLFSAFLKEYSGDVISYANLRISYGGVYKQLGFTFLHRSAPSYFYTKGGTRVSRYNAQKHKLHRLLLGYNPDFSEKQNMESNGYFRAWDCGNLVYVFRRK